VSLFDLRDAEIQSAGMALTHHRSILLGQVLNVGQLTLIGLLANERRKMGVADR